MSSRYPDLLRRVTLAAAFFLSVLSLIWLLGWQTHQAHYSQTTANKLATLQAGDTPFRWDFSDPRQVILPAANGLVGADFESDGLYALIGKQGGNISLRLRDRSLPAERFYWLYLEIEVAQPSRLDLYWRSELSGPDYGYTGIRLKPGQNRVSLNLKDLPWHPVRSRHPQGQSETVPWGGRGGIVRALRIHPGRGGNFVFRISQLVIGQMPITDAGSDSNPESIEKPSTPIQTTHPYTAHPLTPERARWLADLHQREAPGVVVIPYGFDESTLPAATTNDALFPDPKPTPLWLWLSCAAFIALTLIRIIRPPQQGTLALLDLLLISAGAFTLLVGVNDPEVFPTWAGLVSVSLALIVLVGNQRGFAIPWPRPPDRKAWRTTAMISFPLVLLLVLIGLLSGGSQRWSEIWPGVLMYLLWALLQQFILGPVLTERWRILLPQSPYLCSGLGGLMFGLFHFPNFALMVATFLMGSLWAWVYLRHRCIMPQALMHGLLGSLLFAVAPPWLLQNAAIGIAYFR